MKKKELERRELYLSLTLDDHGRNAIDQGIVEDINDPDFWEKVKIPEECTFLHYWDLDDCIREFLEVMEEQGRIRISSRNSSEGEAIVHEILEIIKRLEVNEK